MNPINSKRSWFSSLLIESLEVYSFESDHRFILVWIKFSKPSGLRISFSNLGNLCSDIFGLWDDFWLYLADVDYYYLSSVSVLLSGIAWVSQSDLNHIWDRISQIWRGLNWVCPVWRIHNLGLSKSRLNWLIKVVTDFDKILLFLKIETLLNNGVE